MSRQQLQAELQELEAHIFRKGTRQIKRSIGAKTIYRYNEILKMLKAFEPEKPQQTPTVRPLGLAWDVKDG